LQYLIVTITHDLYLPISGLISLGRARLNQAILQHPLYAGENKIAWLTQSPVIELRHKILTPKKHQKYLRNLLTAMSNLCMAR
jgi:hypothetical protein